MVDLCIEIGADILEANDVYVGKNIDLKTRVENLRDRIKLQDHAKRQTYRLEHIFNVLHYDRPFAESTSGYMMDLLMETRALLAAWRESDMKLVRQLTK